MSGYDNMVPPRAKIYYFCTRKKIKSFITKTSKQVKMLKKANVLELVNFLLMKQA